MERTFTAYVEFDPDRKLYSGTIPGLTGAHSQGSSLDEVRENLREVVELIIEEKSARGEPLEIGTFVGTSRLWSPLEQAAHRQREDEGEGFAPIGLRARAAKGQPHLFSSSRRQKDDRPASRGARSSTATDS